MKTNEIRISIAAPREYVFQYTLEPKNTALWQESKETVDTDQIGLGSRYTNDHGIFEVSDYEKNAFVERSQVKGKHQSSYTFHKISETDTEIIYFESMTDYSDLSHTLSRKEFQKLKSLLEHNPHLHAQS